MRPTLAESAALPAVAPDAEGRMAIVVAGLDVFDGQWVGIVLIDGKVDRGFLVRTFEEALGCIPGSAKAIGVDIPIGLPDAERPSDLAARGKLRGVQAASVFMTPPLEVLRAANWDAALLLHREMRKKGMSIQTWGLRKKILEVQDLPTTRPVFEVHPEVSFWAMNREQPLPHSKHTWPGHNRRRQLLEEHGIVVPNDLGGLERAGVEDVLDAAAAAWSAHRIATGKAAGLPQGSWGRETIHY